MAQPVGRRANVAIAQLFVAAALWGVAMTGTKYALGGFDPITLLAVELVAAALALTVAARVRGGVRGTVPSWRLAGVLGMLEPATAYLGETIGLQRTSAANAAVILGLESCFVVLLAALFLRERIDGALGFAVLAGFAGLAMLEGSGWMSGPGVGDALVVGGTFSAAVYVIVARRMDPSVDALLLTVRQFTVAACAVVPLAVCSWARGNESLPSHVAPHFWVAALLVGVAGYAASFVLYNNAIVVIEAGPAAIIINLIPAFGLLSAVTLLGERLGAHQLLGALLLTASVAIFSWMHLRPRSILPPVRPTPAVSARVDEFLARHPDLPTPFLVLDLDVVRDRFTSLRSALPRADVFFAVKANPDPDVIMLLAELGSSFDVASVGEIELCLRLGVEPERLSCGNTIKKQRDIATAHAYGVRTYTVDSLPELRKLQGVCSEATVLVRLATDGGGADWPLSRKFGCTSAEAEMMLLEAGESGYELGLSFHVGSQQRDPVAWQRPLHAVANLARTVARYGYRVDVVNLGGGLPSRHFASTPPIAQYGACIDEAIVAALGDLPHLRFMTEPGRYLVGDAGVIRSEVVLVTDKAGDRGRRWVYLDIGMFNGLTETQEEAIRYRMRCPDTTGSTRDCVLAGPTCDSLDILYERQLYPLPEDLRAGQFVDLLSTGAYTSSYSSVWFNGFEPLRSYLLPASVHATSVQATSAL